MAGHGDAVDEMRTDDKPDKEKSRAFYEAVRRAIVEDPGHPRPRHTLSSDRGVVPFIQRREAFLMGAGLWPWFFPQALTAPDDDERRVHLYIDVSGSTSRLWPLLYGLVLHLADEIGEPAWVFSNAVRPVTLREIQGGHVPTTGGTDFDCVAEHALRQRFRRILVITDGDADLDGALARRLKRERTDLLLVLTEPSRDCPLHPLAKASWVVPEAMEHSWRPRRRAAP